MATPVSASERRKGANGELEVVKLLHAHGWTDAKRSSDGRSQNERGDVADGPTGVHLEVRRRETVNVWACLRQGRARSQGGRHSGRRVSAQPLGLVRRPAARHSARPARPARER